MKKWIVTIMAAVTILGLTGCGEAYLGGFLDDMSDLWTKIDFGNYYHAEDSDYDVEDSDDWMTLYLYFEDNESDKISFEEAKDSFDRIEDRMMEMKENGSEIVSSVEQLNTWLEECSKKYPDLF